MLWRPHLSTFYLFFFFFFCKGPEPPHSRGVFPFFGRTNRYGFDCIDSLVWVNEWMLMDFGLGWVGLGCGGRESQGMEEKKRESSKQDGWMEQKV